MAQRSSTGSRADRGIPWRSVGVGTLAGLILVGLVVLFVSLGGGDGGSGDGGGGDDDASAPAIPVRIEGEVALPTMAFTRFDGTAGSLADYRGRPMVVNFFASWCEPCRRELPAFEQVHQELGDRVAFVGLNNADELQDGKAMAASAGVTFDLARDPQGEFLKAFNGIALPTTAFVSSEGDVVEIRNGALSAEKLRERIDELLR